MHGCACLSVCTVCGQVGFGQCVDNNVWKGVGFISGTAAAVSAVLPALKPGRTVCIQAGHWCYSATVSTHILVPKAQPAFGEYTGEFNRGGVFFLC